MPNTQKNTAPSPADTSKATSNDAARRIVFISHSNPQDNDFTTWLAARLASARYEVWSDVTKLIGGEVFWKDIEEAIRLHTLKFVSLAITRSDTVRNA